MTIPVITEFGKNVFESVTTGNVGKFENLDQESEPTSSR